MAKLELNPCKEGYVDLFLDNAGQGITVIDASRGRPKPRDNRRGLFIGGSKDCNNVRVIFSSSINRQDNLNPLEYSSKMPKSRKNLYIGLACILFALALVSPVLWKQARPLRERFAFLRLQSRCLEHPIPRETVVFEEDPMKGAELLKNATYERVGTIVKPAVQFRPPDWIAVTMNVARFARPISYCQLRGSSGAARLISLEVSLLSGGIETDSYMLRIYIFAPATFTSPLRLLRTEEFTSLISPKRAQKIRLFAGYQDPNDGSVVKMKYETIDGAGTISLRLMDNDTMTVYSIDGPMAQLRKELERKYGPLPY